MAHSRGKKNNTPIKKLLKEFDSNLHESEYGLDTLLFFFTGKTLCTYIYSIFLFLDSKVAITFLILSFLLAIPTVRCGKNTLRPDRNIINNNFLMHVEVSKKYKYL